MPLCGDIYSRRVYTERVRSVLWTDICPGQPVLSEDSAVDKLLLIFGFDREPE